jgi:hypothetical protein
MIAIDPARQVYLKLFGHGDLIDLIQSKLVSVGFDKRQIVPICPSKHADVNDYLALLTMPEEPTQLQIRRITKARTEDPIREGDGQSDWIESELLFTIDLFAKS